VLEVVLGESRKVILFTPVKVPAELDILLNPLVSLKFEESLYKVETHSSPEETKVLPLTIINILLVVLVGVMEADKFVITKDVELVIVFEVVVAVTI
tara:strand:+ start:745 stop:1035 length:291 start_codon:yes stop_codon:yes gene_type:complete